MPRPLQILALCASARQGSWNQRLLDHAIAEAEKLEAAVTTVDLRSLELPLYDGDLELFTPPAGAARFRQSLRDHDCLLITTPEYNGSIPPLLKNTIDWSSRPVDGKNNLEPWTGKDTRRQLKLSLR